MHIRTQISLHLSISCSSLDNRKEKMPGLISNSNDLLDDGTSRQDLWDRIFSDGLEVLLVECAMVNDDIERDCFISRVYCWFTEKLTERRELPKKGEVQSNCIEVYYRFT